jgi:hypothetical protein
MGRQRTITGAYSDSNFNDGSKDKIRNVDVGPAEGVIRNPYGIKSFADAIDTDGMRNDGHNGGFSGPIRPSKGRVQGGVQPEVNTKSFGEQKQFDKRYKREKFNWE